MTTTINADPTPKQKFHGHPDHLAAHNRMVESQEFDLSVDIALMEYQRMLVALTPTDANLNQAAVSHLKITGAMEFVKCLKNLGLMPVPPTTKPVGNLQHKR